MTPEEVRARLWLFAAKVAGVVASVANSASQRYAARAARALRKFRPEPVSRHH